MRGEVEDIVFEGNRVYAVVSGVKVEIGREKTPFTYLLLGRNVEVENGEIVASELPDMEKQFFFMVFEKLGDPKPSLKTVVYEGRKLTTPW